MVKKDNILKKKKITKIHIICALPQGGGREAGGGCWCC